MYVIPKGSFLVNSMAKYFVLFTCCSSSPCRVQELVVTNIQACFFDSEGMALAAL